MTSGKVSFGALFKYILLNSIFFINVNSELILVNEEYKPIKFNADIKDVYENTILSTIKHLYGSESTPNNQFNADIKHVYENPNISTIKHSYGSKSTPNNQYNADIKHLYENTILKYQWPAVIPYYFNDALMTNIDRTEYATTIKQGYQQLIKFIDNKIQDAQSRLESFNSLIKSNKQYHAVFVPNTLIELAILQTKKRIVTPQQQSNGKVDCTQFLNQFYTDIDVQKTDCVPKLRGAWGFAHGWRQNDAEEYQKQIKIFREDGNIDEIIDIYFQSIDILYNYFNNDKSINQFNNFNFNWNNLNKNNIKNLVNQIGNGIKSNSHYAHDFGPFFDLNVYSKLSIDTIELEIEDYLNDYKTQIHTRIYRGTTGVEINDTFVLDSCYDSGKKRAKTDFSFGQTLFALSFHDRAELSRKGTGRPEASGARAVDYMLADPVFGKAYGYTLKLPINDYFQSYLYSIHSNNNERKTRLMDMFNVFYFAPISTVEGIFAAYETSHVRTRKIQVLPSNDEFNIGHELYAFGYFLDHNTADEYKQYIENIWCQKFTSYLMDAKVMTAAVDIEDIQNTNQKNQRSILDDIIKQCIAVTPSGFGGNCGIGGSGGAQLRFLLR